MEILFSNLRSKEIINLFDGKRLGHLIDVSFDKETGKVLGFVVPGLKKMFRKVDDIFIPLELIKKIGDDVILVRLDGLGPAPAVKNEAEEKERQTYARYRKVEKER